MKHIHHYMHVVMSVHYTNVFELYYYMKYY